MRQPRERVDEVGLARPVGAVDCSNGQNLLVEFLKLASCSAILVHRDH